MQTLFKTLTQVGVLFIYFFKLIDTKDHSYLPDLLRSNSNFRFQTAESLTSGQRRIFSQLLGPPERITRTCSVESDEAVATTRVELQTGVAEQFLAVEG